MTFEQIVADRPEFGFAFYAYEPGQPVTLEVHAPGGDMFTFHGKDLADVVEQAFGPFEEEPEELEPAEEEEPEEGSIFD